jgi:hypothetical protein
MHNRWKASIICFLCIFLNACIGSIPAQPWFEGDVDWPSTYRFQVEIDKKRENFEFSTSIQYVDESNTWIYLYVNDFNKGFASIQYSAQDAYIEKENGERIKPILYITSSNAKNISPGLPWGGKIPDTAIQEAIVNPNKSGGIHDGVSLRFNTAPSNTRMRWVLHFGKVTIKDKEIEIPDKIIVVRGRQWYAVPVQ